MLDTFADRKALIEFVLLDSGADVKFWEGISLMAKWYRYENALRKSRKYRLLSEKYGNSLGEEVEILLFRRNLNDLDDED